MNPVELLFKAQYVWMSDNFVSVILNGYQPDVSVTVPPSSFDLTGPQSLSKPEDELEHAIFANPTLLLHSLATLISAQSEGQSGRLLNDSSANIFYVRSIDGGLYSVLVRYEDAQRLWRCGAYLIKNGRIKLPNIRIFLPNECM